MKRLSKKRLAIYFRNFIFGVEDSLVSTVGLLSGIAIADVPKSTIFLSGIVLIFVEAFSMGAGSFLSETSAEELKKHQQKTGATALAAVIMFASYFIAGFIPLGPYLLFPTDQAFIISISASLLSLFLLGVLGARIADRCWIKNAFRMLIIGGVAIGLGVLVGQLVTTL